MRYSEAGASAVEYGLLAFAIAAVIAMAVFGLGVATQGLVVQNSAAYESCVQGLVLGRVRPPPGMSARPTATPSGRRTVSLSGTRHQSVPAA